MKILQWPREINALQLKKTHEKKIQHTKKTSSSVWQHMCYKYSKRNQIQKCTANTHNKWQTWLRHAYCSMSWKVSFLFILTSWLYVRCEYLQHVSYLVALWVFAAHVLSNWRCFLNLLVFFLFACVFFSGIALSSLGHHKILPSYTHLYVIPNP